MCSCSHGFVGLTPLPLDLKRRRPLYLQTCSGFYQLPFSSFSPSVNFFFFFLSAIAIFSVQILTFRKISLFLCHTETYNVYLTKQFNVTIKTYLIMVPLFSRVSVPPERSRLGVLIQAALRRLKGHENSSACRVLVRLVSGEIQEHNSLKCFC